MSLKRNLFLLMAVAGLFFLVAGITFQRGQKAGQQTRPSSVSKEEFMLQSAQRSSVLTRQGVALLKQNKLAESIGSFMEAVAVFPPATEAYMMLVKIFLMTGQEQKMYEMLERAGHSFPSFDDIVGMIDDESLSRIPLPPLEDVYIAPFQGNKKMAMTFMFDDGEANVYTGILPLFDKYDFKATIPVVAGQVAAHDGDPYRGSWHQWKDAAARGFEIANHSMGHRDANELKPADLKREIDDAKAEIEARTGKQVRSYVFPLDRYSDMVFDHVLRSHLAVRKPDFLRSVYDRAMVIIYGGPKFSLATANRLVDIGMDRHVWIVSESHGLDQAGAAQYKPMSVDFLEQHLAYIRKNSQDVWVGTFGDVFEYLDLRKKTKVVRKDAGVGQADIMIHHDSSQKKLSRPLTVVVQAGQKDVAGLSATTPAGMALKAWRCGAGSVCIDMDVCDEPVRVTWGGGQR